MDAELRFVQIFTVAYLTFFIGLSVTEGQEAFLFHTVYIGAITCFVSFYYKRMHLTRALITMLSVFGFLHLVGAVMYHDGIRMYEYPLLFGTHFDNLVHSVGGAVAALIGHNFLQNHLDDQMKHHPIPFIFLLMMFAAGLGTLNEIGELIGVVYFNAGPFVGGYLNNAIDLVFNLLGATVSACTIYLFHYRKHETMQTFKDAFGSDSPQS